MLKCEPWFEKYPQWFTEERAKLEALGFVLNEERLKAERIVIFDGPCHAAPGRKLRLAFPNAFPSAAPKIFDASNTPRLPRHQRIDNGQLCLFGFSEHRWNAMLSGADAVAEAEQLIQDVLAGKDSADEVPEPLTRTLPFAQGAAVLVPFPISTAITCETEQTGIATLRFRHSGSKMKETRGQGVIMSLKLNGKVIHAEEPTLREFLGSDLNLDVIALAKTPTSQDFETIINRTVRTAHLKKNRAECWFVIVFPQESSLRAASSPGWAVVRAALANNRREMIRVFSHLPEQRTARIPHLANIGSKRVMIIGCGSIGSAIGTKLASSGVRSFRLIDFDYMEPENSVRHELGIRSFGVNKAEALVSRLDSLNPGSAAASKFFPFTVASTSTMAEEEKFFALLNESDIVVDATGGHAVSHYLNDVCYEAKLPVVYASVTNGAWSGEVVTSVPRNTPCWVCWNEQYCDDHPPAAPRDSGEVFPPGCDQPTFTGTAYDLGFVANLATDRIVQVLLHGFCDLKQSYIRWHGRTDQGPVFKAEFLSITSRSGCYYCG